MFSENYYFILFSAFAKMLGMRRICRHTLLLASQVCVCVCVCDRDREREKESATDRKQCGLSSVGLL
jgi:hypothetical protein